MATALPGMDPNASSLTSALSDSNVQLPAWLQRLAERPSWLWNIGIGLIIGLSLLRWLLQR